jgi:hypothetical protein
LEDKVFNNGWQYERTVRIMGNDGGVFNVGTESYEEKEGLSRGVLNY